MPGSPRSRPRFRTPLRTLLRTAGVLALTLWLGSGSCTVSYNSCTSNDPENPCKLHPHPDTTSPVTGDRVPDPEALRIRAFELVFGDATSAGGLRRLAIVDGPTLPGAYGPGPYEARDVARLTRGVLGTHPELFAESQDLRLSAVEVGTSVTTVRWRRSRAVDEGGLTFLFVDGRLAQIDEALPR